jgi:hypothetical protein
MTLNQSDRNIIALPGQGPRVVDLARMNVEQRVAFLLDRCQRLDAKVGGALQGMRELTDLGHVLAGMLDVIEQRLGLEPGALDAEVAAATARRREELEAAPRRTFTAQGEAATGGPLYAHSRSVRVLQAFAHPLTTAQPDAPDGAHSAR